MYLNWKNGKIESQTEAVDPFLLNPTVHAFALLDLGYSSYETWTTRPMLLEGFGVLRTLCLCGLVCSA